MAKKYLSFDELLDAAKVQSARSGAKSVRMPAEKKKKKKYDGYSRFDFNWSDYVMTPEGTAFKDSYKTPAQKLALSPYDNILDPYQEARKTEPIRTPLPRTNRLPLPEGFKSAILAMENGDQLLDKDVASGFVAAKRTTDRAHERLAEVGRDKQTSVEKLPAWARLAGLLGYDQYAAYGAGDAYKQTDAGKAMTEVAKSVAGRDKVEPTKYGVERLNAFPAAWEGFKSGINVPRVNMGLGEDITLDSADDSTVKRDEFRKALGMAADEFVELPGGERGATAGRMVRNVPKMARKGLTALVYDAAANISGLGGLLQNELPEIKTLDMSKYLGGYGADAYKITNENRDRFRQQIAANSGRVRANIDKGLSLRDSIGASETYTDLGWPRDENKVNGLRAAGTLVEEGLLSPSSYLSFGKTGAQKMAVRNLAEDAAVDTVPTAIRNAQKVAANNSLDALNITNRVLAEGATKREVGMAMGDLIKLGDDDVVSAVRGALSFRPRTVVDTARTTLGANADDFIKRVTAKAGRYGLNADELLSLTPQQVAASTPDVQRLVASALRESMDVAPIRFAGVNVPGTSAIGDALGAVGDYADIAGGKLARKLGLGDSPRDLNLLTRLKGTINGNGGEVSRTLEQQQIGKLAAETRLAKEHPQRIANEELAALRKETGLPKSKLERMVVDAQKYYPDAEIKAADEISLPSLPNDNPTLKTTGISYYDDTIDHSPFWNKNYESNADYYAKEKGVTGDLVEMSPDEYLAATRAGRGEGFNEFVQQGAVEEYAQRMRNGEKAPALMLNYGDGGYLDQEGRHRALAAKLAGFDKVNVVVAKKTDTPAARQVSKLYSLLDSPRFGGSLDELQGPTRPAVEAGLDLDRAVQSAIDDGSPYTPEQLRAAMEYQQNSAVASAENVRKLLLGTGEFGSPNKPNMYQPKRFPSAGRERQAQRLLAEAYGTPDNFEGGLLQSLKGDKGYLDSAQFDDDKIRSMVDTWRSERVPEKEISSRLEAYEKSARYPNPRARAEAGLLTETNPVQAFEQLSSEQAKLSAREEFLHSLASTYGKRLGANDKVPRELSGAVVELRDGTRYLLNSDADVKRITHLADTANLIQRNKPGAIANAVSGLYMPIMTGARPAFTKINTLGNAVLSLRNGYGRKGLKAAQLEALLFGARGNIDNIPARAAANPDDGFIRNTINRMNSITDEDRALLQAGTEGGARNPVLMNPSQDFIPGQETPLYAVPGVSQYLKANRTVNGMSENIGRMSVWLDEMDKSLVDRPLAAKQRANDILFDYDRNSLPESVQKFAQVAPFFNFMYRNIPAQAEYFGKRPFLFDNLTLGVRQNLGSSKNEDQRDMLLSQPDYMREQLGFHQGDATDLMGNSLGQSMSRVRFPEEDALRAVDIGDEIIHGNPAEKLAAAAKIPLELIGPQFGQLASLVANAGNRSSDPIDMANDLFSRIPIIPQITRGMDDRAAGTFKNDDDRLPRTLANLVNMSPTTDYNPASWLNQNVNASKNELQKLIGRTENPSRLDQMMLGVPEGGIPIPDRSLGDKMADSRIADLTRENDAANRKITEGNESLDKVENKIHSYRKWQKGLADGEKAQKNPKPRVDDGRDTPFTQEEWEYMRVRDPEAYEFWKNRWKGKTGSTAFDRLINRTQLWNTDVNE